LPTMVGPSTVWAAGSAALGCVGTRRLVQSARNLRQRHGLGLEPSGSATMRGGAVVRPGPTGRRRDGLEGLEPKRVCRAGSGWCPWLGRPIFTVASVRGCLGGW
jgi:hypothetical protein